MTATATAETPTASGPSPSRRMWPRFGSVVAFVAAAGALVAAVAGGITEPTGIAAIAAVVATVVAYGIGPLLITIAMRQSALSSWWAVAAALLAAALWSAAALLFAMPTLAVAPAMIDALVSSAPSASGLWILVASVAAVRAGLQRWSLVVVAAFLAVLIVGSVLIQLGGFDIRTVLVPLGWAVWMVDAGRAPHADIARHPSAGTRRCADAVRELRRATTQGRSRVLQRLRIAYGETEAGG